MSSIKDAFLGFIDGSGFYARSTSGRRDGKVRVKTYTTPQDACTFVARSIGQSRNLTMRLQASQLVPGALDLLRPLLSDDEAALLELFGAKPHVASWRPSTSRERPARRAA